MQVNVSSRAGQVARMRFVVVADTHINESEEGGSSPFITNASANARARFVFNEIAAMDPAPAFVIHLGDIVHPVPALPAFDEAVDHFKTMTEPLTMPLHLVPGNHDVGDKQIDWMPADLICDDFLGKYREAFGPDYFAFDQDGLRFIMLNSVLFNARLPQEQIQREWLTEQLNTAGDRRVFVSMHYPPYIFEPEERSSYDNIDQPARSWLLAQLAHPSVEAVFAGHVHNFWYHRLGKAHMYLLPSTAFLRHDFSEFYRAAPAVEFGRGDPHRYGYFVVDVFDDGHIAYSVRTLGEQAAPGQRESTRPSLSLAHPASSDLVRFGVELRHPWAEISQIPATGGVQEFGRKWARNDYPLQALWEMGVRLAKIPEQDLTDPPVARRLTELASFGHRFIVTCLGQPSADVLALDLAAMGVVAVEMNLTGARFEERADRIKQAHDALAGQGVALLWAKILAGDDSRYDGGQFTHFVKSGFVAPELDNWSSTISGHLAKPCIHGITVRVDFEQTLADVAAQASAFADRANCDILISLKLSGPSVAGHRGGDDALVARAAQAMVLSQCHQRVQYVFDTFMDVDRGYYPRDAFIDRCYNPRPAAIACAALNAWLSGRGLCELVEATDAGLSFRVGDQAAILISGDGAALERALDAQPDATTALNLNHDLRQPVATFRDGLSAQSGMQTILLW